MHMPMKLPKSVLHLLAGLVIGIGLTGSYLLLRDTEKQGEPNANCDKFAGPSVDNGKGMRASSHTTACTTLGTSVVHYVYVHPASQQSGPGDLVFSYSQDSIGTDLKVTWLKEDHLVLEVDRVTSVSRLHTARASIHIDYKIQGQ